MDFADFQPVLSVATRMNAFGRPWCVAGGWAIDLFLGELTRQHGDIEIAILRDDQIAVKDHLIDFEFRIVEGAKPRLWRDRQMIMPPVHELHARGPRGLSIEVLLNERYEQQWVYRRHLKVRLPIDQWIRRGAFGVPVIAPAIALLYKSKNPRPHDELDFRTALHRLDPADRRWLLDALMTTSPQHPWARVL